MDLVRNGAAGFDGLLALGGAGRKAQVGLSAADGQGRSIGERGGSDGGRRIGFRELEKPLFLIVQAVRARRLRRGNTGHQLHDEPVNLVFPFLLEQGAADAHGYREHGHQRQDGSVGEG